jgi:hypothetical protein
MFDHRNPEKGPYVPVEIERKKKIFDFKGWSSVYPGSLKRDNLYAHIHLNYLTPCRRFILEKLMVVSLVKNHICENTFFSVIR